MGAARAISPLTSSLYLFALVLSYVCLFADGQTLQVRVDGVDLSTDETEDCSGGADPEWRVRVSIDSGNNFVQWNEGRTNIGTSGYQGISSSGLIVDGAASLTDNFVVELDAFEDDDFACDLPFSSGGPDDGECGGYGGTITELMTSKAPCTFHEVEIIRSCTSDGSTIEWRAKVQYRYEYNHGSVINCNPNPPTPAPTRNPTRNPTRDPTPVPTNPPTNNPTPLPTSQPTPQPTSEPTAQPTAEPSPEPTPQPSNQPTTATPTADPTSEPTPEPTPVPTDEPTQLPTNEPTLGPTNSPTSTNTPTADPTREPTEGPSSSPTTPSPTDQPTSEPTTREPTFLPTAEPTNQPTADPTSLPTPLPSAEPTTRSPTVTGATSEPTFSPTTAAPSASPSTSIPTDAPSVAVTATPTDQPTNTAAPSTPVPTRAPVVASPSNGFEGGAVIIGAGCAAVVGLSALAFLLMRQRRKSAQRADGKVIGSPPKGHGEPTRNPFYVGAGNPQPPHLPPQPLGPPPGF